MMYNCYIRKVLVFVVSFVLISGLLSPIYVSSDSEKYNMSYIYFGNKNEYIDAVNRTRNSLDEISPNYFNLTTDGNLELTGALDVNFINEMHNKGIMVIPFLSNHWDRARGIKALDNREKLADDIASAVIEYNLDGIHIDIENVTENERWAYTDFIRLLRSKLPDKNIAVAVAPNPNGISTGWAGAYDYTSLAQYSDYLMIMAYDEHYNGSDPGPVASAGFVEKCIKYGLSKVSSDKLVLGIPFYGRYWKNGQSFGGYGIGNEDVENLIKCYNGEVYYDQYYQSAKAVITIEANDPKPSVLGTTLSQGTYTIWYDDEESIKYKLSLVNKYNLKGTGSWSLGQESTDTWDYYKLWLNGYYFSDIENHWAHEYILASFENKWMLGRSSISFVPDGTLTRAEATSIMVRMLDLNGNGENENSFKDINGHWAEQDIEIAYKNGIVNGRGSNVFAPDAPITRQEMAVMLSNIIPGEEPSIIMISPYSDISAKNNGWSYKAITKLKELGVFSGYDDGTFRPEKNTTRAEMSVLIDKVSEVLRDTVYATGDSGILN